MKVNGNLQVLGISEIRIPLINNYESSPDDLGKIFINEHGALSYSIEDKVHSVKVQSEQEEPLIVQEIINLLLKTLDFFTLITVNFYLIMAMQF